MSPRDTRTGEVLENMILPALRKGGYIFRTQQVIGRRPGGGRHKVDVIASKSNQTILVSMKWQQVGGTAEQKVPFEVISLLKALRNSEGRFHRAYVVLGGEGWTLRTFYVEGGLNDYIRDTERVKVTTLEGFIALANDGKL